MDDQFKGEVPKIIEKAKGVGVETIINVGCSLKSSKQSVEMAEEYDCLYATLGLHPYDAADATEELMGEWEKMILENNKILAIGECGLDYFKAKVSKEVQEKGFRLQLELAQKVGLPVIIHNRDADEDCLRILKEYRVQAVFHCYGSEITFARKLWYEGYYTSFTGIITYPNTEDLRDVVFEAPMDKFMIETDCPYLAPQNHRGERNEPSYVVDIVEKIAEIKLLDREAIVRMSTENAQEFFLRLGLA